jgi:Arc/MetJ-type ribon-helix-helix transcriptional regulator
MSPAFCMGLTHVVLGPMVGKNCDNSRKRNAVTIQFGPEQERVIDQAIEAGLIRSADEALDIAVDALRGRLRASARPIDVEEWMRKFRAWAHSHPATTPLLSDEAISRESIYRERGR